MAALSKTLRSIEGGMVAFWCPGCDGAHQVRIKAGESTPHPCWSWNGNAERPTFSPSILVRGVDMTEKGRADYEAWAAAGYPQPSPGKFDSRPSVCHSFVTDGQIQFLGDCTHRLAGQTVPIPDFDED
jgi:hypothetical protein